jgi:signal transduction histidine kinase
VKSIRRHLTLGLWVATGALLGFASLGIFLATRQVLISQFDDTLVAKAQALTAAAEVDGKELEFDFTVEDFAGFGPDAGGDYFEVRRENASLVIASPSLGGGSLPRVKPSAAADKMKIKSARLADGRPARLLVRRFLPDDDKKSRFTDLYIIVASQSTDLNRSLGVLGIVLLVTCAATVAATGPIVRLVLARGLRPLDRLGREVREIDPSMLEQRITEVGVPAELSPVASRINDLLSRIGESFERERRFSSHAAHELRTPLAELKTLAEMGARWLDQANPARCGEMLAVISELEVLLDRLSLLARADAGRLVIHPELIESAALIGAAIGRFQTVAAARNLQLIPHPGPDSFRSDPVLITTILNNLLGNATAHAPAGSTIRVHLDKDGLMVENPAPDLTESDIPLLFERFWRKDSSHSGDGHSGLGLSIVQACAKVLGGTCVAELGGDGCLRVRIGLQSGVSL